MNFLVNKILDDGSVSYGLTGSGYVVLIIVCVLLMTIGCFARDNNSKLNVKHIEFAAYFRKRRLGGTKNRPRNPEIMNRCSRLLQITVRL